MKTPGKAIVWPATVDSSKSRHQGRRIGRLTAVDSPKLSELVAAAGRLGLKAETNEHAARPSRWWEKAGYLSLDKGGAAKSSTLKRLAAEVNKLRREKLVK